MPSGGFLRTNFRRTGGQPILTVGGGIPQTSWIGTNAILAQSGRGLRAPYGGFIMGSIINTGGEITGLGGYGYSLSDANISAVIAVSAYGAMSAWFGDGIYGSGYVIMPFAITPKSLNYSDIFSLNLTWSTMVSTAGITYPFGPSVFMIVPMGTALAVCCSGSVRCIWAGWIISAP